MKKVVIDMQNKLFADAIAKALQDFDLDFNAYISEDPGQTEGQCIDCQADILIMAVTSCPPWELESRLNIRNSVKKRAPTCKIVLVVDENSEKKVARQVRQAKKDGLIDQFIYGSISADYLGALIDTL